MRTPRGACSTRSRRCPRTPSCPSAPKAPADSIDRGFLTPRRNEASQQHTVFPGAAKYSPPAGAFPASAPRTAWRSTEPGSVPQQPLGTRQHEPLPSSPRSALPARALKQTLRSRPSSPSSPQRHGAVSHCAGCITARALHERQSGDRDHPEDPVADAPRAHRAAELPLLDGHRHRAGKPGWRSRWTISDADHACDTTLLPREAERSRRSCGGSLARGLRGRTSASVPADASIGNSSVLRTRFQTGGMDDMRSSASSSSSDCRFACATSRASRRQGGIRQQARLGHSGSAAGPRVGCRSGRVTAAPELAATRQLVREAKRQPLIEEAEARPAGLRAYVRPRRCLLRDRRLSKRLRSPPGFRWAATMASTGRFVRRRALVASVSSA